VAGCVPPVSVVIWTNNLQWPSDPGAVAAAGAELEELGFPEVWIGGSSGQFPIIDALLGGTARLAAATGIIQIWVNPADVVATEHHRLTSSYPGRFLLGLGVGHAPLVNTAGAATYHRPLAKLISYLDELDTATAPVPKSERVIAALGPRALALTKQRSAGAHPYNVSPEHTARARSILGPSALLIPEQKVLFTTDASAARRIARKSMANYFRLPNYVNNFRALGFDDGDLTDGGSDRFLDAMVAWGSPEAVAARVRGHVEAGADRVALQVLSPAATPGLPMTEWRRAAEALLT
jgi:probable F420-dependent oxidoreductase